MYNFSAGPGVLPKEVLLEAQKDFIDFKGSGIGFIGLAECLKALIGKHHGESEEAQEGKISIQTPIAQGLLNKRVGDEVEIKIPRGTIRLRIDSITIA